MTAFRSHTMRVTWLTGWSVVAAWIAAWPGHVSPALAETQTTKPAKVDKTVIEPPRQPSAVEILQELMKEERKRHVIMPSRPGKPDEERPKIVETQPTVAPSADDRPLRPDGDMIADRIGRLVRRAKGWFFAFESEGKVLREPPMRILPNRDLETMEIQSANGTRPVKFRISAEVTEYRGANYLLLRKVLVVHDLGNLE